MLAGTAVSYSLFTGLPNAVLKTGLGIFVVAIACDELRRMVRPAGPLPSMSPSAFTGTAFAAGLVHGVTATGGPVSASAARTARASEKPHRG